MLQLASSSQVGKAKEKANTEGTAGAVMEIHVTPFSPAMYSSPCYGGFLLGYFHTDTKNLWILSFVPLRGLLAKTHQ